MLARLAAIAPGAMFSYRRAPDGRGRILYASPALEDLTGLTREALDRDVGQLFARIPAEDLPMLRDALEASEHYRLPLLVDFRLRHRDGGERRLEVRAMPEWEADGAIVWHGFLLDISPRHAEEEVERTQLRLERRLTRLSGIVPGALFSFQALPLGGHAMPYASGKLMEVAGFWPEELAEDVSPLLSAMPSEDRDAFLSAMAEACRRLTSWRSEARLRHPGKGEIWIEWLAEPERLLDGGVLWHGFMHDISRRKAMEAQLRERNRHQETLLKALSDVGLQQMVIENGRIVHVGNRALAREFGFSDADIDAHPPLEAILHPDDRERVLDYHRRRLAGEAVPETYELSLTTRAGERREYEVTVALVPDSRPPRLISIGKDVTERKRAEAELSRHRDHLEELVRERTAAVRESEALLRAVFDNVPFEFWAMDGELRYTLQNAVSAARYGAVVGKRIPDLGLPPEVAAQWEAQDRRVLAGEVLRGEYALEGVGGRKVFESVIAPVTVDGVARGIVGVGIDITERKLAEERIRQWNEELERRVAERTAQLEAAQREFRSLAENTPDNIVRWDCEGRYRYVNPTHERTLGATLAEVLGQEIPESHTHVRAAIAQVVATGRAIQAVRQPVVVAGVEELHDVKLVPEFDPDGRVVGVLGLGRDMTDIYRMQDAIAAREQEFRSLAESSPDNVIRYDRDGRIRYINANLLAALGLATSDEVLGKRSDEAWPDGRFKTVAKAVQRAMATRGLATDEIVVAAPDGGTRYHHIQVVPEFGVDGALVGAIAYGRDVTAIRETERRLTRFAANAPGFFFSLVHRSDDSYAMPFASPGIVDTVGLEPATVADDIAALVALSHPDDIEMTFRLTAESEVGLTPYRVEYRIHHPHKGERWLECRSQPTRESDGSTVWHGFMHDITERKQAEERLNEAREFAESIINAVPDILFEMSRDGVYLNVWSQNQDLLAAQKEALLGRSVRDILSPEAAEAALAAIREADAQGMSYGKEIAILQQNGERRWYEHSLAKKHGRAPGQDTFVVLSRDVTERKCMENTLLASEAQSRERGALLQAVLESSPEVIAFALDRNYRYLAFNTRHRDTMRAIWGKEIAVGTNMLDIIDNHADRLKAQAGFDRALAGENFITEEEYGGEARLYWQIFWSPIRADGGDIVGLTCFVLNITDRKCMEDELRRREQEFRGLVEKSPDSIGRYDRDCRRVYANPALLADLGNCPAAVLGKTPAETFPGSAMAQSYEEAMRRVLTSGEDGVFLLSWTDARGGMVWSHIRLVAEHDGSGAVASVFAIGRDVTESKRTEQRLRASLEFTDGIINAIPDILFEVDGNGTYLNVWTQSPDALGMTKEALIGRNVREVLSPEGAETTLAAIGEAGANGVAYSKVIPFAQPGGEVRWYEHSLAKKAGGEADALRFIILSRDVTERVRMAESLSQSEAKLRGLFELSPLGIALTDMEGRYLEFNEAFRAICGYSAEELRQLDYWTLTPRSYEALEYEQLRALAETGRYGPYEKKYRRGDGTLVPIRLNGLRMDGPDGRQYIWSIVEDISERREHERRLEQALAMTQGVINAIPDLLFQLDRDGLFLNAWAQSLSHLAIPRDALLGRRVDEALPPAAAAAVLAALAEADAAGGSFGRVVHLALPDDEAWFELSVSKKPGDDAALPRFLMLARDVTARKRDEANLRRLTDILEVSVDFVGMMDAQGRLGYHNPAARRMLGLAADADLSRLTLEQVHPDWAVRLIEEEALPVTRERGTWRGETAILRQDGREIPVSQLIMRHSGVDGGPEYYSTVMQDISEHKALETARENALAEARRLAQLRGAFMAQMSHELRTPLNGILGFAQLLLEDDDLNDETRGWVDIIRDSGEHLLAIINQILDFAKIEADKLVLEPRSIRLATFLAMVADIIRVRAEGKRLAFQLEAADLPTFVHGDELRLRQVLLNLLGNAVKFTERGRVALRVSQPAPGRLRFEVRDSGIGIAAEKLDSIFQPFEQLAESGRVAEGTGLGLAISRRLVQLMGGALTVESRPGEGSVFAFELELGCPEAAEADGQQVALADDAACDTEAMPDDDMPVAYALPPRPVLLSLLETARRGNPRRLVREAGALAEAEPALAPFAGHVERLARAYRTRPVVEFIERHLADGASNGPEDGQHATPGSHVR